MAKLISDATAERLTRLLNERRDTERRNQVGSDRLPWVLVRCDSERAVGGDDIRDECYPATILLPNARESTPPAEHPRGILLTVLGDNGVAVAPRRGGVYSCLLTGEVVSDQSGSGSSLVNGRPRAFGVIGGVTSDGVAGGVGGCGWVARLRDDSCLRWRVVSSTGLCAASVTVGASGKLTHSGSVWLSDTALTIDGTDYQLRFSNGGCPGPCLSLLVSSVDQYDLVLDHCSDGVAVFAGGGSTLCPDGDPVEACSDNSFIITVECVSCEDGEVFVPEEDLPATLPADSTTQFTINVTGQSDGQPLRQMMLDLSAPGTGGIGQFAVSVTDPNGATAQVFQSLANGTGSNVTNRVLAIFNDPAVTPIQPLTTAPSGTYQPAQLFASVFTGNPNGTWIINVVNNGPDAGTLNLAAICFSDDCFDAGCGSVQIGNAFFGCGLEISQCGEVYITNETGSCSGTLPTSSPLTYYLSGASEDTFSTTGAPLNGHDIMLRWNPVDLVWVCGMDTCPPLSNFCSSVVSATCPETDPLGRLVVVADFLVTIVDDPCATPGDTFRATFVLW